MILLSLLALSAARSDAISIPPPPKAYVCHRAARPLKIDGRLDEADWKDAAFTDDFVDIQSSVRPRFRTRVKMLWDDRYLYIGADLREPHVRATLTERDSVIFHDNDFEVFIDPDDDGQFYAELEINALNTLWDLLLVRPYRTGGPAVNGWDVKGVRTAVHVDGTLNQPDDVDRGWTVEMAIPWSGLSDIARCPLPPEEGNQWRINFSRVEWQTEVVKGNYRNVPGRPEDNWVWSPQGLVDMHRPDRWGVLEFTRRPPGGTPKPLAGWRERQTLFAVWEAEMRYHGAQGRWGTTVKELGLAASDVEIWTTPHAFEARCGDFWVDSTLRFWSSK